MKLEEQSREGAPTTWHSRSAEDVLRDLGVDLASGLSREQVEASREKHGPNTLGEHRSRSPWSVLWAQFANIMVIVLAVAALVSAIVGEYIDAGAILAILILNAVLGFVQEYRAEKAHEKLRQLSSPKATVRRGGKEQEIDAAELVPGDILLLKEGDSVPADARVIASTGLRTQESALTGESTPVEKTSEPAAEGTPLAERTNMVYKGTALVGGHGEAIIVETGQSTELGRISGMLGKIEREATPLQKRLDRLGKVLALAALAIVGLVFAIGALRGEDLRILFMTSLSLAVAAVPEGLPGVVTIALALGSNRMLRRKALIRRLPAVETLGSVTVICSDKTGTLTQNRMRVSRLQRPGEEPKEVEDRVDEALFPLLGAAALSSDATIEDGEAKGDPMEVAILELAAKSGLDKAEAEKQLPLAAELPFDAKRKRVSIVHKIEKPEGDWAKAVEGIDGHVLFVKGAYDSVVSACTKVRRDGEESPLDKDTTDKEHDDLAASGMRVIAVGYRPLESFTEGSDLAKLEKELIYLGLVGLADPLRPEAKDAVDKCKSAGIRPVMITGDHALTALSIARQVGIDAEEAVAGAEVEKADDSRMEELAKNTSVFARATPSHKLRIVETLQGQGQIVALTGDGVNDAPALKKSDIGVAMGQAGTDVAKDAADMVLLDDNFATVVAAVEEGRTVFDNVRKFVKYLLTSNSAELWVMLVAVAIGMPIPLLPLQILWINLVTDGLPALALAMEPAERSIMKRPPIPPKQGIFADGLGLHVVWVGMLMAAISLSFAFTRDGNPEWRTMLFTTLTLSQIAHVLAIRTFRDSFFRVGPWSNPYLLAACAGAVPLQFAVLYWPPLQDIFATAPLSAAQFGVCAGLSLVIFAAVEIEKTVGRLKSAKQA